MSTTPVTAKAVSAAPAMMRTRLGTGGLLGRSDTPVYGSRTPKRLHAHAIFSLPSPVGRAVHTSDDALLAGMATGDADAAAAFVRRFQARVFGLAATVLHDRGAAEDVAQEAFVRA